MRGKEMEGEEQRKGGQTDRRGRQWEGREV